LTQTRFITTQKIDFIWFIKVKKTGPAQCRACFFCQKTWISDKKRGILLPLPHEAAILVHSGPAV